MIDISRLLIAVIFAVVAALTAMAAGLVADARTSIILWRAFLSFFITGVVVYIGVFLFERFGYGSLIKETEEAMAELDQQAEETDDGNGVESENEEVDALLQAAATASGEFSEDGQEEEGFQPLETDSLRRVVGSDE